MNQSIACGTDGPLIVLMMPFSGKAPENNRQDIRKHNDAMSRLLAKKARSCKRYQANGLLLEVSLYLGCPGSNSNSPNICDSGSFASCVPYQFFHND